MQKNVIRAGFHWINYTVAFVLIATLSACGGGLANLLRDKIVYKVQVVDCQGRPVPAATIWWILVEDSDYKNSELMERLLRRYALDADFVQSTELHPSLLVYRTDLNGKVEIYADGGDIDGKSRVVGYFAAIKRGYYPSFVQDQAPSNTTRSIKISLRLQAQAQYDKRLLAFDLLRAPFPSSDLMSMKRHDYLQDVRQRMRALASELEQDQRFDEASAVYYNLAYLPGVLTMRQEDGGETIIGYINGYDSGNAQRFADKEKALELNRSTPNVLLSKVVHDIHSIGGLGGPQQSAARQLYIQTTEDLIRRYPERLWPKSFHTLYFAYMSEGLCNEACSSFKRAYRFEPGYLSEEQWSSRLNYLNSELERENTGCERCEVDMSTDI